jgi:hypothetical protein
MASVRQGAARRSHGNRSHWRTRESGRHRALTTHLEGSGYSPVAGNRVVNFTDIREISVGHSPNRE